MPFYRLYRDPEARSKGLRLHRIESQPSFDLAWRVGQAFVKPPTAPIACTLEDINASDLPDAFLFDQIPMFSGRLVDCLLAAGVANLEAYPATLTIENGPRLEVPYFAVNIVGLVSADMAASRYDPSSSYPMIEFSELHIAPQAAHGARLFRVAENPSFIIVSEDARRAMESQPLVNVRALPLDQPAAY
jgi:hypothetical protein